MNALQSIYVKLQSKLRYTMKDEKGATMVEYALMLALIAGACVLVVPGVGTAATAAFQAVLDAMTPAG